VGEGLVHALLGADHVAQSGALRVEAREGSFDSITRAPTLVFSALNGNGPKVEHSAQREMLLVQEFAGSTPTRPANVETGSVVGYWERGGGSCRLWAIR
jgi:hypothetical protein